jgi:MtrB/PioB family decaheme-associated outer membrane protein
MGRARGWAGVALAGLAAACLITVATPGRAEQEVGDWRVEGSVEAGGMGRSGNTGSAMFNKYRDMDNGFLGELEMSGEKKDAPYFFDLRVKNPSRDDQLYEGVFGQYGLFKVDLEWDRTPHVISNNAQTIWQLNGDKFQLPASQRAAIAATFAVTGTPAARAAIQNTVQGLLRPVDLGFNTDTGRAGLKLTPTEDLRFNLEYLNIHREGKRPIGMQMTGSTSGPVNELAVPVDNMTHEIKFGAEYAKAKWGLQFNYTGSFFSNNFSGFTVDNPLTAVSTPGVSASDRFSVAPDNNAHTFSLTGTSALPLRTRINGTFAYTMLRQNQTFEYNTGNTAIGVRRNIDDFGSNSADAQANLILGNILLTSRPIDNVTVTTRYRFFDYQNDMPFHQFTNDVFNGGGTTPATSTSKRERYTKQNAGIDLGYRPFRMIALKAGFEWEHWTRADYGDVGDTPVLSNPSNTTNEYIGKFAADFTPADWLLARVTYSYGDRSLNVTHFDPNSELPNANNYFEADRRRNKVDGLLQFNWFDTVTPSLNVGYALDDFYNNNFGLKKNDYLYAGLNLDWTPLKWLTVSADYTYEQYNYEMASRYLVGGNFVTGSVPFNDWSTKVKDEFHNFGLSATFDIVPKKFIITAGYSAALGYTTYDNRNLNLVGPSALNACPAAPPAPAVTCNPQAVAFNWDRIFNVNQTLRIVGKYFVTERLSLRGGFAYERYTERNWTTDPMQPFMGNYDATAPGGAAATFTAQGSQSVWLGATVPNYEAYIWAGFVRYQF